MSTPSKWYDDLDLLQNILFNLCAERVDAFPGGARRGRVIFHNSLKDLFVCINGIEDGGDTTQRGNWIGGKVTIDRLSSEGQNKGKLLVTDGSGGFTFEICDGGTL